MNLLRRFRADRRGVSAIEFAFIAPVMIVIYFSIAELCQAMLVERKVQHSASAIGDLVAQVQSTTPADLADVYSAGSAIVSPFSTATMTIRVSSVVTDANGNATIAWSNAQNTSCLATGSTVTLPANLVGPSQSVIMSEVKYTYTSPVNYWFKSPISWDQVFYLRPRQSTTVACPTCTC